MQSNEEEPSITIDQPPVATFEGTFTGCRKAVSKKIIEYIQSLGVPATKARVQFSEFEDKFHVEFDLNPKTEQVSGMLEMNDQIKRRLRYGPHGFN